MVVPASVDNNFITLIFLLAGGKVLTGNEELEDILIADVSGRSENVIGRREVGKGGSKTPDLLPGSGHEDFVLVVAEGGIVGD